MKQSTLEHVKNDAQITTYWSLIRRLTQLILVSSPPPATSTLSTSFFAIFSSQNGRSSFQVEKAWTKYKSKIGWFDHNPSMKTKRQWRQCTKGSVERSFTLKSISSAKFPVAVTSNLPEERINNKSLCRRIVHHRISILIHTSTKKTMNT